ncbi:MAG: ACT domain-containing protein [Saccharofermentanales bacterium]
MNLDTNCCFVAKTDEENSLVCLTEHVPEHTLACEDGWRAFKIQDILEFSLVGVLSIIFSLLADKGIGIFAILYTTQTKS